MREAKIGYMLLTIIHGLVSLGISAWFGYLFYTNLGPWYALIAIPLTVPIFYILYLLLLTILFLYAMLIKNKKAPENPSRFYLWLVRQNDFLLMSVLRVKIIMRGKELLPKGQRFLIVTNHRSNFDQMVMIKALKEKPMIYISKPDNFKMPIAGPFIKAAGFIPIDRENAAEGIKSIYKAIDLIKEDKASIAISPEGTRNKGEDILLPFHPGSFQAAVQSGCPIVIASLNGTAQIHKRAPWRKTKVYFNILRTLYPEDYANMSTVDIAKLSMNLITEKLNEEGLIL